MTVPNRICVGQIGAPHGLRGEVRLRSFTSDESAIAKYGPLETDDGRSLRILSLRGAKGQFIARLADIGDRNAAEELVNLNLYIPRDRLPDPGDPDEFYHADLVGLAVVDRDGERVGTVVAIHNFGAADLIEIRASRRRRHGIRAVRRHQRAESRCGGGTDRFTGAAGV